MAVVQLNYYSNIDTSIEDMQNTLDGNFIGHHRVTLTNYNTTGLPAIAIGSIVENNGSLFKFETETAISGSPTDGDVFIYLVPSGDPTLGTATVTPTFTNTAPTWSDSKQGWYGTSTTANYRYLEFVMTKSTSTYSNKRIFTYDDNVGDLTLTTATITSAAIGEITALTNPLKSKFQFNFYISSSSRTEDSIFDTLKDYIPTSGDKILLNGTLYNIGTSTLYIVSYAERSGTSSITIISMDTSGTLTGLSIDDGDTGTTWACSLAW